jgi:hypothetical protein
MRKLGFKMRISKSVSFITFLKYSMFRNLGRRKILHRTFGTLLQSMQGKSFK